MTATQTVTIYTMNFCPYCKKAKELLSRREIAFNEIHVDDNDDATWDMLFQKSGMKTMPQIFHNQGASQKLIGGYTELAELDKKDSLQSLKK